MGFFRQRLLLDMMRAASITFLGVLRGTARERVKRVFAATSTQRIALPHPISRVTHLGASVKILSSQHSKTSSPQAVMGRYSQRSLAKVNNPPKYPIVLILLRKLGEYFIFILIAVTYETSELILRDGVPKTTAHIESSPTITSKLL